MRLPTVGVLVLALCTKKVGSTYPLVVKSAVVVQILEKFSICFAAIEIHICDLEVVEEVAEIPQIAIRIPVSR